MPRRTVLRERDRAVVVCTSVADLRKVASSIREEIMKRYIFVGVCLAVFAGLADVPVHAQDSRIDRFQRQLDLIQSETTRSLAEDVPAGQRVYFDYGGWASFNFLAVDDETGHTSILRQPELTVYGQLNYDNTHEVFVRARFAYLDFNSGESFDGQGDRSNNNLERAYYRLHLHNAISSEPTTRRDWSLTFTGGRQLVHWVNGLVLSAEIDGVMLEGHYGPVNFTALAGVTNPNTVDFDASRPRYNRDTSRGFFGGMISTQLGTHQPFIYGLVQKDYNDDPALIVGPTTTRFDYDSYYIGIGSRGALGDNIVYGVELVYQGGDALSSSFLAGPPPVATAQTREDIEAFALDIRLDYLVGDANRSRLGLEFVLASGDDDRLTTSDTFAGNQPGTTDEAFNAFGLINTGLAFAPAVSNLVMVRGSASTFPVPSHALTERMQIGVDLFLYSKLDSNAPISEPTSNDAFLGFETDLWMVWQLTSDLTLSARYGIFVPGDAITSTSKPRHFFFMGMTYGF